MDKKYSIIRQTTRDLEGYIELGLKNQPCVLYGTHSEPFVFICKEELCDYDYIKSNGILHKTLQNASGSTIVCSKGDVALGFFGSFEFCKEMLKIMEHEFSKAINGGKIISNDFVYDCKKYGAMTEICFGDVYYLGIHISNSIDEDLIKNICKKQTIKVPSALPTPITEQDIERVFTSYMEGL